MYERVESTDHIDQIQSTKINKLFKIDDIFCKMIYMKIGKNEFVTSVTNRFEKTKIKIKIKYKKNYNLSYLLKQLSPTDTAVEIFS